MSKILDLAKNGIYYRPLDTGSAPVEQEEDGDFVRGLKKAGHQIPQTVGGAIALVGDATGTQGMVDYGMDVYQKREEAIQKISKESDSLSNVLEGEGDAVDWLQNSAGYVAGQVGTALVTGGVGGFIGKQLAQRGIREVISRGATSQAAKLVAEKVARRGAMAGAGTAMFGQNLVQEAGSIYPEARHEAESDGRTLNGSDLGRVAGSAVVAAGVDTAMDALMLGRVMSGGRRAGEGMVKAARRELPLAMAREGVTEGIQTGIERWGAQKELGTADAIREYVDSIGVGVVGGGMGGALSVLHAQKVPDAGPLSRAANTAIDQEALRLTNDPEPLIVFPDGTTGRKIELEAYIKQFPEENGERNAMRAKLMGLDAKTGEPLEQEAPPEPEFAASPAEQDARLADWAAEHEPATLEYAHSLLAAPGAKGKNLMIAPHPSGQGYTVVPSSWLTLDSQATLGALQKPQPAAPKEKGKAPAAPEPVPVGVPDTSWQDNPYSAFKFADQERAESFMRNKGADPEKFWVQPEGEQFAIKPKTVAAPAAEPSAAPAPEAAATIYNPVGQPFVTEFSAKLKWAKGGYKDTHVVAPADGGGFVLQPKGATDGNGTPAVPDDGSAGRVASDRPAGGTAPADGLGSGVNDGSAEQAPAADAIADPDPEPDPVHAAGSADAEPALATEMKVEVAAHEAATSPTNDLPEPTEAQKDAGNYRKGHVSLFGLGIAIENPAGSTRSGVDRDGKPWSNTMRHHYGYIKRTTGADGDHVDTFVGANPASERVFIVDQIDPDTGKFDEHKVILGADSLDDARAIYAANYAKGWQGGKDVSETSVEGFKTWLNEGDTTKPYAPQAEKEAANVPEPAQVPEEDPAAQGAQAAAQPAAEPEPVAQPDDGIPKAFYKKVKVPVDVYVEETGTTETAEIPADQALESVREDIASLKALIKCMKG